MPQSYEDELRSEETKKAFLEYLETHPDERFWQAVRNFSGYAFILASDVAPGLGEITPENTKDTFYWEGRNHLNANRAPEGS